jgi:hypothetical protein
MMYVSVFLPGVYDAILVIQRYSPRLCSITKTRQEAERKIIGGRNETLLSDVFRLQCTGSTLTPSHDVHLPKY